MTFIMKIKRPLFFILVLFVLVSGCAGQQEKQWPLCAKIHRFLFYKERIPLEKEFNKFLSENDNQTIYNEFVLYLQYYKLSNVISPDQLLRQGTDYDYLELPPFAIPPKKYWQNMLPVLRLIRDELKPVLKDIEVVSGYRSEKYNQQAGGAKRSRHLFFEAVDVIPGSEITKEDLDRLLLSIWNKRGKKYKMGLGLYSKKRFHVDTFKFRRW